MIDVIDDDSRIKYIVSNRSKKYFARIVYLIDTSKIYTNEGVYDKISHTVFDNADEAGSYIRNNLE